MRIKPRKFAVATMLTAMAGIAGLATAGTASASTASALAKTESSAVTTDSAAVTCVSGASAVSIHNIGNDNGTYVGPPVLSNDQYEQVLTAASATQFCPGYEATIGGVKYYLYEDYITSKCLTANINNNELYEATCGEYLGSQEWHYYALSGGDTLKNYYTSACVWFLKPFGVTDPINIGGCTLNENNNIAEVPAD
jgi:hypothetical protein